MVVYYYPVVSLRYRRDVVRLLSTVKVTVRYHPPPCFLPSYLPLDSVTDSVTDLVYYPFFMYI